MDGHVERKPIVGSQQEAGDVYPYADLFVVVGGGLTSHSCCLFSENHENQRKMRFFGRKKKDG